MNPLILGLVLALAFVAFLIFQAVRILPEYERGVVFRLGRLRPTDYGPGLFLLIPIVDRMTRVSLRTVVHDVPPQDIITRDNVSMKVNAVVYFRVMNPRKAVVEVENYPLRHEPARTDDPALRAGAGRAGRTALGAGEDQPRAAVDPRQTDRSVGHQGLGGRGQARRPAVRDAACDGQTGRGRARETGQDHPRRGRGPGRVEPGRRPPAKLARDSQARCSCATSRR